jgi:hypothetical protein
MSRPALDRKGRYTQSLTELETQRALGLPKGKPVDLAPRPSTFPGGQRKPLPGQLELREEQR